MKSDSGFSRLELNFGAAKANYRYFRSLLKPETRMLVLVKANAYGHGSVEFASMMQSAGADYLAVALPVEGVELRRGGISLPILVLTAGTDFFDEIITNRLEPGIPNVETLTAFRTELQRRGITGYPIHIKLDTGMHRLGFMESEMEDLLRSLGPEVEVKSVYSHLAVADDPSMDAHTEAQLDLFEKMSSRLCDALPRRPLRHILNSAGIERFTDRQYDMVRLGIGIYGVSALPDKALAPVASFKVKILQIKKLMPEDGAIGYGRHGVIAQDGTLIATIPAGYADGIDRHLGCGRATFSLHGRRVPTIGNICMDMCMIDVTGVPDVKVGDTVTIFGEDPRVEELAGILDTIPYEVLVSVPKRIERTIIK